MKYLLDTHILIWALFSDDKLPKNAFSIINNPENEIYYSVVSVWETVIKNNKAPDKMPVSGYDLAKGCEIAGMVVVPITKEHALSLNTLHRIENAPPHNDPFDRMLIAQAKAENMVLLTHDRLLQNYSEPCVKTI